MGALAALLGLLAPVPVLAQAPQVPQPPHAQQPPPPPQQNPPPPPAASPYQAVRVKLNQETLILAASRPGTGYLAMANDLASAVAGKGNIRVLAVAGDGGLANVKDVLFLRGIDLAIVPANVLAHAKATKAAGGALAQRLAYVTVLYSEEVHVIAGPGIAGIGDLRGKRVAVPLDDNTAHFTASDIFRSLGIDVESVALAPADALDEVRTGTVAAAVLVGGKSLGQVSALPKDGSLRLLPVPAPPSEGYAPAVLSSEDYPALIPPKAMVETVAVGAVLVAGKGGDEAARRVARHTPALLEAIARLAVSQRHPKWKDVNLGAVLPGWSRIDAAEAWLNRAFAQRKDLLKGQLDEAVRTEKRVKPSEVPALQGKSSEVSPAQRKSSEAAAPQRKTEDAGPQRKKLFDDFDAWARKSASSEPAVK